MLSRGKPHIGGGTADVHHYGVLLLRQEGRAANGVRRTAGNREDGIALGVVHGHERAVVLPQVHRHVGQTLGSQRGLEAVGRRARHVVERGVQDGCILALQEAERSDFGRQRNGEFLAQLLAQHRRGALLVRVGNGREHAGHRNGLEAFFADDARNRANLVLVEGADLATVELVAAVHQEVAHAHGALQLVGPVGHAADGRGGRRTHAQSGNLVEALALDDGIRAMRGAQHGEADVLSGLHANLRDHFVHGRNDAAHDVFGGGTFGGSDQLQVAVDDNRVGVRAADVDAQAPRAQLTCHYACTSWIFVA